MNETIRKYENWLMNKKEQFDETVMRNTTLSQAEKDDLWDAFIAEVKPMSVKLQKVYDDCAAMQKTLAKRIKSHQQQGWMR